MRTPIAILAGTLLVACASGTRVVYVPVATSTPAPAPVKVIPAPLPPVGVTIARVEDSRLLVSTNQPAYLAVFEIVPNRGVTLVYPASPRQRQMALAGSNWLNVSWRSARGMIDDDDRGMRGRRRRSLEHHVYVLASERPLRLTDNAFDDDALAAMLGARLTQAADPYETMAALSRRFVPRGNDEDWGEDVYTMDVSRPVTTVRVAKIYCPDGSVVYTRDEMADRTACPWRPQGRNTPAPRPDSVVASNGRRVPSPMDPGGVARIFRIPTPVEAPDTHPVNGGDVANGRPNGNGNGNANGNGGHDANDESGRGRDNPKGNNGNHYGWGNGNGNDGKDKPTGAGGKDNNGNNGNNGSNVANGNSGNANDGKDKSNNGNHYGQEKGNNGNGSNGNGSNNGNNANGQAQVQQQGKPDHPSQAQPNEPKPADAKPAEAKPAEAKPAEVKPDPKPAAEPAAKDEPKPKQEQKPEAKQENKGMRGLMDRMRAKADSSDAKDKDNKGKPDRD
jgi:hypothetical protein